MTKHAILYDPVCGFCQVCVAVVLRWDRQGRLRPVALGTEEADTLLAGMPEAEQMASWHLVDARWLGFGAENAPHTNHLEIRSAGAAFSPLFRLLPGGAPLARIADRFPRASEAAYRWVADHRTAFGRPLPAAAKRWADRVISASARNSR
jgi:predicted DCC family thiol-disulfide oxidoreductase YuxK